MTDLQYCKDRSVIYNNYNWSIGHYYSDSMDDYIRENDLRYEWKYGDLFPHIHKLVEEDLTEMLSREFSMMYECVKYFVMKATMVFFSQKKETIEYDIQVTVHEVADHNKQNCYSGIFAKIVITGNEVDIFKKDLTMFLHK